MTGTLTDRPVNKLFPLEINSKHASVDVVNNDDNIRKTKSTPKREAALICENIRKYAGTK